MLPPEAPIVPTPVIRPAVDTGTPRCSAPARRGRGGTDVGHQCSRIVSGPETPMPRSAVASMQGTLTLCAALVATITLNSPSTTRPLKLLSASMTTPRPLELVTLSAPLAPPPVAFRVVVVVAAFVSEHQISSQGGCRRGLRQPPCLVSAATAASTPRRRAVGETRFQDALGRGACTVGHDSTPVGSPHGPEWSPTGGAPIIPTAVAHVVNEVFEADRRVPGARSRPPKPRTAGCRAASGTWPPSAGRSRCPARAAARRSGHR